MDSKSLEFFCRYSIKKRGQKATMNTIFRGTEHIRYDSVNLYDSLKMFEKYFRHLPDTLKNDIMTDGFTEFNHNALSSLAYRYENKNIIFSYTDEEKNLEDEIKDIHSACLKIPTSSAKSAARFTTAWQVILNV